MLSYNPKGLQAIKDWLGTGSINLFGLPFAGKDTHGAELAQLFDGVMLSGGDILRSSMIPAHVKEAIDAGGLAPTDEFARIVMPYLSKAEFKDHPLILSSVGRWHGEEKGVMKATTESGHPMKAAIYLELDPAVARQRWRNSQEVGDRGGREDDAEYLLDVRFEEFRVKTLPVIEAYRDKGLLIQVDGVPPIESVSRTILDALLARATES
jgi:adenylate kinase